MDHHDLDGLIDSLSEEVNSILSEPKKNWRDIWDRIKEIGASFKETRYPTWDEKDHAWSRFQSLVEEVKNAQEEDRQKWENKSQLSIAHKEDILNCIRQAALPSEISEAIYAVSGFKLIEIIVDSTIPGGSERDDAKDELVAASATLREGWGLLSSYKDEMLGRDKQEVFNALSEAQSQLNQAWDNYKEAKQSAHEARQRAWEEKQRSWEEKQQAWRERVESNIEKNETRLDNLQEMRDKKESHISDLQDKIGSDCSSNYRERVEGWIDEEEDKLQDINEQISRVEGWLSEDRAKLR